MYAVCVVSAWPYITLQKRSSVQRVLEPDEAGFAEDNYRYRTRAKSTCRPTSRLLLVLRRGQCRAASSRPCSVAVRTVDAT